MQPGPGDRKDARGLLVRPPYSSRHSRLRHTYVRKPTLSRDMAHGNRHGRLQIGGSTELYDRPRPVARVSSSQRDLQVWSGFFYADFFSTGQLDVSAIAFRHG